MASCIGVCLSLFPFHSFSFSSDIRMRYILHTMYTSIWLRAFWRQVHTQDDHRKLRSSAYSRPRRALDDVRKDRCACSQIICCGSDGAECTWVDLQEQQSREQHVYKHAGDSTVIGVVLWYTSWAHGSHRQLKDINDMNKLYPTISSFRRKWLKANGPFHSLDLSTRETWTQWTNCGPFSSTSSCSGIFRFKNCDELFDHTAHIWYHQITPKDCKKFMHSMPNRIRAVVRREAKNKWQISVSELFRALIMVHARILKRIYKMGLESKHFCRCAWLA